MTDHDRSIVSVAETGDGNYTQEIVAGPHRLAADEPADAGGRDTGPNPYDLLLAALGACTSITLRMYAERKGMALDRITVRLSHRKIHAADCAECEVKEGKVDRIDREIELAGALSAAEIERLMVIADKCPVHQTLTRRNQIVTTQVD